MTAKLASLLGALAGHEDMARLLSREDATVALAEPARAFVLAGFAQLCAGDVLGVTPTATEAERGVHDLSAFSDRRLLFLPAWETLPFERVSPSVETMGRRLEALWRLVGDDNPDRERLLVVAPIKALLQRLGSHPEAAAPITLRPGDRVELDELVERFVHAGYRREYQVEHRGEVAVRGGIVDVFPSTGEIAVRIDCFGDEVDRLTEFDVADQRSVHDLSLVEIFGARELELSEELRARAASASTEVAFAHDRFQAIARGETFDGMESFLPWLANGDTLLTDLLAPESRVVLLDPRRMRDRALELGDEEAALATSLASTWDVGDEVTFPRLHVGFERLLTKTRAVVSSSPPIADGPEMAAFRVTGWPTHLGDASVLARRIGELVASDSAVVVAADGRGSADRLSEVLAAEGLRVMRHDQGGEDASRSLRSPGVHVVLATIDRGFIMDEAKVAVLAEADVTGRRRPHRVPRARARAVEGFFDDLGPGAYVVHHVHGVARYGGMVARAIGGAERDYLLLEYRGGDKLYVPSDQIDAVTPYSGGEQPTLSRLNGSEWQRQRSRVRHAVREIAQELVVLYQRRLAEPGHAFAPDTPWQAELEEAFPFPETVDQLRAIVDVKADMERPSPMDRLVCGDVGFGKTEVAVRAVFKAVQDGKQAAVLVPTTLLARQHFQTFSERYAPFPVRVEMLSRFLTPTEARSVINRLKAGTVDVVIGTHRLLADDVEFADLGLLVVDEEQRFGVSHKETMKKLRVGVDVLTLTASPIPRTLEMGLTGIRDLSVIDTPPAQRQPILTYVGEEDSHAIAEAIRRELLREGQVFFVHNRVRDIERIAASVRDLVSEARVVVAHGQMDEGTLEQVVLDFSEGRADVLVCTTIIESGIDMPTVNTLVVDRADLLGLGQLHQLRGRVGRAGQRAYAYLFHPRDRALTEQAYERLRTIGEHTELGSGFKIAMRDLEIRGAGNLLGNDQSGHIAAVGYDLYVRMVAEAVAELKGEAPPEPAEIKLDLPTNAHLPSTYVAREDLRLEAYRRLASVREAKEVDDIGSEWLDRYGPLPPPAEGLLAIGRLRAECVRTGVREVTAVPFRPGASGVGRAGEAVVRISPLELRASQRVRLTRLSPRALYKEDVAQLIVPVPAGNQLADAISTLLAALVEVVPANGPTKDETSGLAVDATRP